jgi:hypothetical protein
MVTIVTDILIFGLKSYIFLKKNDEKSSKNNELEMKTGQK